MTDSTTKSTRSTAKGSRKPAAKTPKAAADAPAAPKAAATKKPAARKAPAKKANPPASPSLSAEERYRLVAEAAYLRAEQRGFVGGDPVEDWLAAEAEIEQLLSNHTHAVAM